MASQSTMGKLHDMRLSVMARAYRDQEEVPPAGEMSFDERLAMIADAEWDSRRTNKRLRCLRQANFPEHDANIADVRYDDDRGLDRAQILELSNCSWIASRRNVIIAGASGAGKTWISNALGVAACNAFCTVRCTRLRSCSTSSPSSRARNGSSSARSTIHIDGAESMRKRMMGLG